MLPASLWDITRHPSAASGQLQPDPTRPWCKTREDWQSSAHPGDPRSAGHQALLCSVTTSRLPFPCLHHKQGGTLIPSSSSADGSSQPQHFPGARLWLWGLCNTQGRAEDTSCATSSRASADRGCTCATRTAPLVISLTAASASGEK